MKNLPTTERDDARNAEGARIAEETPDSGAPEENIDGIAETIGSLGRWQILVCLAVSLVKFPVAWHQLAIVFTAPLGQGYNCTSPGRTGAKDQCVVPSVNGTRTECTEWEFDTSDFTETMISQWSLVCDRSHYANLQQSVLMFGILLGNVAFGRLADRYGRKKPLMISVILQLGSGIGCAVVPWYPALLALKLTSALAIGGTMVTSFVICMEIVGPEWRAAITVLYQIPYGLGHASLAGLAYRFRDWRHLQLAISLPSIVLLGYWCVVPESPRWLLAVGRQRTARRILERAAEWNGIEAKDVPSLLRKHCVYQNARRTAMDERASFVDLVRTPNMRRKSLAIFFNWVVCGMGLFGMSQYIGQVGGDAFVNFAVTGAMQIPGNFVAWWTMNAWGRKITLVCSNSVAGIAALSLVFVSEETAWLRLVLACAGIVGMSVSFTTAYLFSGELFPTVVRNIGVGTSSMCARIGSMLAPFVVSLALVEVWLPPVIFGVFPLMGAALCSLVPETSGCKLPETLQDGEEFGKKTKRARNDKELEAESKL